MKKKENRNSYIKAEHLPAKLAKRLQEFFDENRFAYTTKNNFLQCVSIIFFHQISKGNGMFYFAPLGRNYWKGIFGGNYHERVITPLLINQIIESKDFLYRTILNNIQRQRGKDKGLVGIRYRINPELLGDKYINVPYINKGKVQTAEEAMLEGHGEFVIPEIKNLNFRVMVDEVKASNWIENNAERICTEMLKEEFVQTLPDNLLIQCHVFDDKGSFNTRYSSVRRFKHLAIERKLDFFYFNKDFYIAQIKEFLEHRVPALIYHYKHQISKLNGALLEERQSPVTLRLYSPLTSFPSRLLQFIYINNKTVVQLDLRTSQFLIFANILNVYINNGEEHLLSLFKRKQNQTYLRRLVKILEAHKVQLPTIGIDIESPTSGENSLSDVAKFIRDIFFKDFYEVVKQELLMQDRLLAKNALFKLLFKKTNRPDALLVKLSRLYPIVMNIIAEFKKNEYSEDKDENKESNFSVFLQCIEAEVFIDNILKTLRNEGIPSFTRHDSIVIASGFEEQAEAIARDVFKKFGFRYNHKIEDKFWESIDFEELEDSTYMQWLIDDDTLASDYYEDNQEEKFMELTEENIDTIERIKEIGIRDHYSEYVDEYFLEEIMNLPFLNELHRMYIAEDIANIQSGMSFLQERTESMLRWLVTYEI